MAGLTKVAGGIRTEKRHSAEDEAAQLAQRRHALFQLFFMLGDHIMHGQRFSHSLTHFPAGQQGQHTDVGCEVHDQCCKVRGKRSVKALHATDCYPYTSSLPLDLVFKRDRSQLPVCISCGL